MKIIGKNKPEIDAKPSFQFLEAGALFSEEMAKLSQYQGPPVGVYRFKTHKEMNQMDIDLTVANIVRLEKLRKLVI